MSFLSSFSLFLPLFCSSLSLGIYKKEKGGGLLPLSSHGIGLGWLGGHWAAAPRSSIRLVPSAFSPQWQGTR